MKRDGSKPAILVIDDDRKFSQALAGALQKIGYEAETIDQPRSALKLIKSGKMDIGLVLLDCWMPHISGFQVIKEIKNHDPCIPVVMMSGHGTAATVDKMKDRGADGFLSKPFTIRSLKQSVDSALDQGRRYREGTIIAKVTGDRAVSILLADDCDGFRNSISQFLTRNGYYVEQCRNGEEAVLKAIGGDYDIILMDINMPGINGVQAISEIKRVVPEAFIVVITGEAEDTEIRAALEEGSYLCLRKPFNLQDLLCRIEYLLGVGAEHRRKIRSRKTWEQLPHWKKTLLKARDGLKNWGQDARDWWMSYGARLTLWSVGMVVFMYVLILLVVQSANTMENARRTPGLYQMYDTIVGYLERDEMRERNLISPGE